MIFNLPTLPFAKDALVPHLSIETIEYHYGKHHQTYVDNLNKLIVNTEFANKTSLEEIIKTANGNIFNNAAQIWNHTFYWNCLKPGGGEPEAKTTLTEALFRDFGSYVQFKEAFTKTATTFFGSGWIWLIKNAAGNLEIVTTVNAATPMANGQMALLTCDVWEHAYYIDYRNARARYIDAFWQMINWDFVQNNFDAALVL